MIDARLIVALCLWWALYLLAILMVLFLPHPCSKALLIVDDLDRCDPSQMVEIIESIKLLLEDEQIHDRVQVVMLLQEENIRSAILGKV